MTIDRDDPLTDRDAELEELAKGDRTGAVVKGRFHNPDDALTYMDATQVADATGAPDPEKINTELDALLTRKPYLAKPGRPQPERQEDPAFAAYDAAVRMQGIFRGLAKPDPAAFGLTQAAIDARSTAAAALDPEVEATLKRITTTERNLGVKQTHLGRRLSSD